MSHSAFGVLSWTGHLIIMSRVLDPMYDVNEMHVLYYFETQNCNFCPAIFVDIMWMQLCFSKLPVTFLWIHSLFAVWESDLFWLVFTVRRAEGSSCR
uniref:Uncharacterized protein n=1 Tax=Arundo donax TaxID=35708 RepID=A0A0A9EUZ5_ARUDO